MDHLVTRTNCAAQVHQSRLYLKYCTRTFSTDQCSLVRELRKREAGQVMITSTALDDRIYRRVFDGRPDQIREVRRFIRKHLDGHPSAPDVALVTSELTTNAWEHTRTGVPGGTFTVVARRRPDNAIRIEVQDDGGPSDFRSTTSTQKEGGRGLGLVNALTVAWGVTGDAVSRTVWAEFKP